MAVVGFWEGGGGFVEEEEFGTLYNLSNGYFSICGLVLGWRHSFNRRRRC